MLRTGTISRASGRAAAALAPVGHARQRASVRARSGPEDVDSALAAADALLRAVGGGRAARGGSAMSSVEEELSALGYACDESGCVLVAPGRPRAAAAAAAGAPVLSSLLAGVGWRIGVPRDSDDPDVPAVAGGAAWELPLTSDELADLVACVAQLGAAVHRLAGEGQWLPAGGERPVSRAKAQAGNLTLQATWAPAPGAAAEPGFTLECVLRVRQRAVAVAWPADAAVELAAALAGAGGGGGASGGAAAEAAPAQVGSPIAAQA